MVTFFYFAEERLAKGMLELGELGAIAIGVEDDLGHLTEGAVLVKVVL